MKFTTVELAQARSLMENRKTDLNALRRLRKLHAVGLSPGVLDEVTYGPESGMTILNLACESNRLGDVLTSLDQFRSERPIPSPAARRRGDLRRGIV